MDIFLCIALIVSVVAVIGLHKLEKECRSWWATTLGSPLNPFLERSFSATTIGGFRLTYSVRFVVERVNDGLYFINHMFLRETQEAFAVELNESFVVSTLFVEDGFRFRFGWDHDETRMKGSSFPELKLCLCFKEKEEFFCYDVPSSKVITAFQKCDPFDTSNGCRVKLDGFQPNVSEALIRENYAMLTDEAKACLEQSHRYQEFDEMLAIAALKRRLEFMDGRRQVHETEEIDIETESAGSGLKIKWRFKQGAPSGYDLICFRKTGGFFRDQWDEFNNGVLIIQSRKDGEVIELLPEGQAQFYTLFLRSWAQDGGQPAKRNPLRFQITIANKEETNAIDRILRRFEARKTVDPARESIAKALKELGLVMEFNDALDTMEKSLVADIKKKKLPKPEEKEKIDFVRDAVRLQRDKYEP